MEPNPASDDRHDHPSLASGGIERFLVDSGAVLAGRIQGGGGSIEANPVLRRLLKSRGAETIEGVMSPEDVGLWRHALTEVERGGEPVELQLSVEVVPGGYLAFRVRLESADAGLIRFVAVPSDDVFEAMRKLSVALKAARRGLQRRGRVDPLTGLGDRGRADHWLGQAVSRAIRTGEPLACLMVDLDTFKAVNDSLGHLEGDRRLKSAAKVLAALWPPGLAARFGGDEFLVLWPGLDTREAIEAAEGLRLALNTALTNGTASIGLACVREGDEPDSLLARADSALVRREATRKKPGGVRVVTARRSILESERGFIETHPVSVSTQAQARKPGDSRVSRPARAAGGTPAIGTWRR